MKISSILNEYNVNTICDIGCGDWRFSQFVNWGDCIYTGIDCVKSVIDKNKQSFTTDTINFHHKALDEMYVPKGYDLIILKDVIQHWEDEDILKFLQLVIDNNKYVFLTNGYKFMRDSNKNKLTKRNIQNQYRYHPVDISKYP